MYSDCLKFQFLSEAMQAYYRKQTTPLTVLTTTRKKAEYMLQQIKYIVLECHLSNSLTDDY